MKCLKSGGGFEKDVHMETTMPLKSNYKIYRTRQENSAIIFASRMKTKIQNYRILQVS